MEDSILDRRKFLKISTIWASGILLIPKASLLAQTNSNQFEQWYRILEYAIWTPSPHNMQAWRIQLISDTKANILYDPKQLLPAGDPEFKFMTLAMGIFLEYLQISANSLNLSITHTDDLHMLDGKNKTITHFCSIELNSNQVASNYQAELIKSRRTSRLHYDGNPVPTFIMDKLVQESAAFQHKLSYSEDPDLLEWFIDLNQKALFHDLANDPVRKEIDNLFRYTKKEAKETPYGLSAKCMQFPGRLVRSVFQKPKLWLEGSRSKMLRKTYKNQFKGTKTIAWIQGPWETPKELVQAGKLMGRLWLQIEQCGYVIQPLGSLITNPMAHQAINQKLQLNELEDKLWLIMRIGKSDRAPRSKRIPINQIIST